MLAICELAFTEAWDQNTMQPPPDAPGQKVEPANHRIDSLERNGMEKAHADFGEIVLVVSAVV